MKLLIAGSRSIMEFDLTAYVSPDTELIISGGAKGVDSLAEQYADEHRISKLILHPRYDLYGKAAPLKRNEAMVELADYVLVLWNGTSRGTKHTMEYARAMGKPITVVRCENSVPSPK